MRINKMCYKQDMLCVCSKNNGEGHVEKSFLATAGLLVRFLTLPSASG